jgi:hypothetical protein
MTANPESLPVNCSMSVRNTPMRCWASRRRQRHSVVTAAQQTQVKTLLTRLVSELVSL